MPVQAGPMRLRPVVDDAAELLGATAERRGVCVAIEIPDDIEVVGDPARLAQVASNLLDNAIKFTGGGRGSRVSARPSDEPGFVRIEFSDTGVGIPAEDLPRLAERFYRVDKARSSELGGTGLGLSIVKHIVLAHGGRFGLDSRLGQGTVVRIDLPDGSVRPRGAGGPPSRVAPVGRSE